jgi:hypothetical protein
MTSFRSYHGKAKEDNDFCAPVYLRSKLSKMAVKSFQIDSEADAYFPRCAAKSSPWFSSHAPPRSVSLYVRAMLNESLDAAPAPQLQLSGPHLLRSCWSPFSVPRALVTFLDHLRDVVEEGD